MKPLTASVSANAAASLGSKRRHIYWSLVCLYLEFATAGLFLTSNLWSVTLFRVWTCHLWSVSEFELDCCKTAVVLCCCRVGYCISTTIVGLLVCCICMHAAC